MSGLPKNVKRFEGGEDPDGSANIRKPIRSIPLTSFNREVLVYSIHWRKPGTLGLLSTT